MSAKRSIDFLRQVAEQATKTNTFDSVVRRLNITGGGEGRCIAEFTVAQDDVNMRGSIHGGLTSTILDNLGSYVLLSKSLKPGNAVDMQMMFMRTSFIGEELVADAHAVGTNDSVAIIECEIRSKDKGDLVAKGSQTKYFTSA